MATSFTSRDRTRRRAPAAPVAHPRLPLHDPADGRRVIEFRGVSKLYSGDVGLDQATFSVDREEFVFLVGSTDRASRR